MEEKSLAFEILEKQQQTILRLIKNLKLIVILYTLVLFTITSVFCYIYFDTEYEVSTETTTVESTEGTAIYNEDGEINYGQNNQDGSNEKKSKEE